jgi:predicted O-linked N-acetylglucosamine transferase (SPINDLY family)
LHCRRRPTRAQVGLPDNAFVYASLNGMQKLTANCFALWMTILKEVPDSVLWLLAGDAETNQRLHDAAAQRGVSAERVLFAHKSANPHHLARMSLADLFLDTTPYGAHSIAADALTMGLPILTVQERSSASRFCSSVIAAAGLADLICGTPEEYVKRAIAFGRDPQSLFAVATNCGSGASRASLATSRRWRVVSRNCFGRCGANASAARRPNQI